MLYKPTRSFQILFLFTFFYPRFSLSSDLTLCYSALYSEYESCILTQQKNWIETQLKTEANSDVFLEAYQSVHHAFTQSSPPLTLSGYASLHGLFLEISLKNDTRAKRLAYMIQLHLALIDSIQKRGDLIQLPETQEYLGSLIRPAYRLFQENQEDLRAVLKEEQTHLQGRSIAQKIEPAPSIQSLKRRLEAYHKQFGHGKSDKEGENKIPPLKHSK